VPPDFNITITGADDWAMQGRVNDDQTSQKEVSVNSSIYSRKWDFLGKVDVIYKSNELTEYEDLFSTPIRGGRLVIDGHFYIVSLNGTINKRSIPISSYYLGRTKLQVSRYRVDYSCETGTHLVQYTPNVRGTVGT